MIALDADHLLSLRALARADTNAGPVTQLPGGHVIRARGRGLETAEIRAFAHGDDPRHLDRNTTARTGHPHTRSFHAERDRTTLLMADFRPSMLWGTRRCLRSVAAAEALCVVGWRAVAAGGRVSFLAALAGEPVAQPARSRDRGMVAVIGAMVRAHDRALGTSTHQDTPLARTLETANRIAPRGAEVLLATALDSPGKGFDAAALALGQRADFSVIRIADAFETAPPRGRFRFRTTSGFSGVAAPESGAPADPLDLVASVYHAAHGPEDQPRNA
ncbi:MAG: DUF58 domain-containing protein [Pseudomonadota bacterium]